MMKHWLLTLTIAALAGVIALAFLYPHEMVSPGNLIPAHASLQNDCFACHTPFRSASPDRCISCHTVADIGRKTTKGVPIPAKRARPPFHQALVEQNCLACHSDHPTPALTRRPVKRFDHALLASNLRGQCQSCHVAPDNEQHRGIKLPCAQCHQASGWKPATFDHSRYFPLTGDHDTACVTCHVGQNYKRYTCYGCHEHQRSRMIAKHREEGITNINNCVRCHRSGHGEEGRNEGNGEGGRNGEGERDDD